jgi:hypothetical protein
MAGKFNPRRSFDFRNERFTQISESHCGPAVVQMLLQYLGIEVTQEAVAEAGGAAALIEVHGMRVDQLGLAVRQLAPQTYFWYKDYSTIEDLVRVVNDYDFLAGVEWQGVFEDTLEDETEDGDYGHYSVITMADTKKRELVIVDPYKDFRSQYRNFSFDFFMSRWWDTNEVPDPVTGKGRLVEDRQMMFTVTPKKAKFPKLLGMKRFA